MSKRKRVTVEDLPESTLPELRGPWAGVFLYCPSCGNEYSATRGDYFWMPAGKPFTCDNGHRSTFMVLARKQALIEYVS